MFCGDESTVNDQAYAGDEHVSVNVETKLGGGLLVLEVVVAR
jgi:hypothetical protein